MYKYFIDTNTTIKCDNMQSAVLRAYQDAINNYATEKIAILLSPMCSSFDQFRSFEDRGNMFISIVNQIVGSCV